jgi:hypothetical protein
MILSGEDIGGIGDVGGRLSLKRAINHAADEAGFGDRRNRIAISRR